MTEQLNAQIIWSKDEVAKLATLAAQKKESAATRLAASVSETADAQTAADQARAELVAAQQRSADAEQRVQAATDSGGKAKADLDVATKAESDAQFADLQLKIIGFLVSNNAPEALITGALGVVQGLVAVGDLLVGIAPGTPPVETPVVTAPPAEVPVVAAPPAEVPVVTALPAADTAPVASAPTSAPLTETPMADQPPVFSSPA